MSETESLSKEEGAMIPVSEEVAEPKPEAQKKPSKKRGIGKIISVEKNKEEDFDGERYLTLRFYPKLLSAAKWKRAKRAMSLLQELVIKYVKNIQNPVTNKTLRIRKPIVWISPKMNEYIWSRGAKNPPRRVRVRVLYKIINDRKGEVELRVFPI